MLLNKKPNILYILNTSDVPNNVILGHASFAKEAGFMPVFLFPYRDRLDNFETYYSEYDILRLNFIFSNYSSFRYMFSIIKMIIHTTNILFFRLNAKHILAIDLTGTLACFFLKIRGVRVYTLVNDNFSARYAIKPYLFKILRFIEGLFYILICNSCIFPDKSRYMLLGSPKIKSLKIIPNVLKDSFVPKYIGSQSDKLIVLICGWLVQSRGLELISEILKKTDNDVEFLIVGSGDSSIIMDLVKSKRVTYLEHVSRDETLAIMSKVDINFAFYNPSILINRFALPQKIYDSLLVGCPIFINTEVEMSKDLIENRSCISTEYSDVSAISVKLNYLLKNKLFLLDISSSIALYRTSLPKYDEIKRNAVEMYKSFSDISL